MLNYYIETDIFQTAIQRLTFSNCIDLKALCESACTQTDEFYFEIEDNEKKCVDKYRDALKKYENILRNLCKDSHPNESASKLIGFPKIYDDFIFNSNVEMYNEVAGLIGVSTIEQILPISLIEDASFLDGATPTYEFISKYYPYYPPKERNGFNLVEFIIILNMFMNIQRRGLITINKHWLSKNDRERAKKMAEKLIESINSKEMFALYVHVFFDVLLDIQNELHNDKAEKYLKLAFLPKSLKDRKDAFRAYKTYLLKKKTPGAIEYGESPIETGFEEYNSYEQLVVYGAMDDYTMVEYVFEDIVPLAFNILFDYDFDGYFCRNFGKEDGEKKAKDFKKTREYELAKEYSNIINIFIKKAMSQAEETLRKIYIEDDSPLNMEE